MKTDNLFLITALICILCGSCQKIERNHVDPRPQVNFSGDQISYSISKVGDAIEIPVKLQVAPKSEVKVRYELTGPLGKDEYIATPEVLTFSQDKTSEIIRITNNSHQKSNTDMLLSITEVPTGYREGLINYLTIVFGGSPIAVFGERRTTMNRTGIIPIHLKDIKGGWFRATSDLEIQVKVDPEQSTAIEGEHFRLRTTNPIVKKRDRSTTLLVDRLKYDPNHNKICLKIIPRAGIAIDELYSRCIVTIVPQDISGTWKYKSFNIDDFSWMEDPNYPPIKGEDGDFLKVQKVDDTTYSFHFELKGSLKYYFTQSPTTAVFSREFITQEGHGDHLVEFTINGINENISPNFQTVRSGVIGLRLGKQADGKRVLTLYVYDMNPKEYFFESYSYMKESPTKYPMADYPARYTFVEE